MTFFKDGFLKDDCFKFIVRYTAGVQMSLILVPCCTYPGMFNKLLLTNTKGFQSELSDSPLCPPVRSQPGKQSDPKNVGRSNHFLLSGCCVFPSHLEVQFKSLPWPPWPYLMGSLAYLTSYCFLSLVVLQPHWPCSVPSTIPSQCVCTYSRLFWNVLA